MPSGPGNDGPGEVFFELTQLGQQMRIAAIDAATSTEVVVIAPLTATRTQMQNLALAKLRRKLVASEEKAPSQDGAGPSHVVFKTV